MHVGVNYPWFDYGWDFGLGPPEWRGDRTTPRWYDKIDDQLEHLHGLGISLIRWFILADGLTYGTGAQAPYIDAGSAEWRFDPPPIAADTVDHFEELLRRFSSFNAVHGNPIQLLPVLIDFHFCQAGMPILSLDPADPETTEPNPNWVKQGRADCIADAGKRQVFLDTALEPLLQVSRQNADALYAWEIINEPDWITSGWHPNRRNDHPIDSPAMQDFIEGALQRVQQAGFNATVGFGLIETLLRSEIYADLNQFHHYPGGTRQLPPQMFDPRFPGIVGEFSTATNDIWPELGMRRQTVADRLRRIKAQRYPAAIPWSFLAKDQYSSWSGSVERQVRAFTRDE